MKVFIATENTISKVGDRLFLSNAFCKVIERYHRFFEHVVLCTRCENKTIDDITDIYREGTEIIDELIQIGSLKTFVQGKHNRAIEDGIKNCDIVVARVPSIVANKAAKLAKKHNIPYLVEVIGCAWDSYWNYSLFGKVVAPAAFLGMKRCVANADYATYVTEKFLQHRYPCHCKSINCSNVYIQECSEEVFKKRLERIKESDSKKTLTLMTAAAVDVPYKGQEYVIKAIPEINKKGIKVDYKLAGFGDQTRLKKIAEECGVADQVRFLGTLSHDEVLAEEDCADIYIQPSLQEGLPRSVIEAMSRGCPALGARTAGIPELIDDECVFKPASESDISRTVLMLVKADMSIYAKHNFEKAKEYLTEVLEARRKDFFNSVIEEVVNS